MTGFLLGLRWIPLGEGLPKIGVSVDVADQSGTYEGVLHAQRGWLCFTYGGAVEIWPTHWRPRGAGPFPAAGGGRVSVNLMNLGGLAAFVSEARLPPFQRGYVWTTEQAELLLDSVCRGFPVGAILAWGARSGRTFGPAAGDYILDGQQRLTALTGLRPGGELVHVVCWHLEEARWRVYGPAAIPDGVVPIEDRDHVMGLGTAERRAFGRAYDRLRFYSQIPVHGVGGSLEDAIEAFRRVNVGGTPIDPGEIKRLTDGLTAGGMRP